MKAKGLVSIHKRTLSAMLAKYAARVEEEYQEQRKKYWDRIYAQMTRRTFFGLLPPKITNPTEDEMKEYVRKISKTTNWHLIPIPWYQRHYEEGMEFVNGWRNAIEASDCSNCVQISPDALMIMRL